jgi:diacylglycerol O-acyltransferase
VIDGVGLNVTAFSYAGNMWICAISCRDMLPDPAFFADCLRASFDQMKEGALREVAFTVAQSQASATVAPGRVARPAKIRRKQTRVNGHAVRKKKTRKAGRAAAGEPGNANA